MSGALADGLCEQSVSSSTRHSDALKSGSPRPLLGEEQRIVTREGQTGNLTPDQSVQGCEAGQGRE